MKSQSFQENQNLKKSQAPKLPSINGVKSINVHHIAFKSTLLAPSGCTFHRTWIIQIPHSRIANEDIEVIIFEKYHKMVICAIC